MARILQTAARVLRVEEATLILRDERIFAAENNKRSIAYRDLVKLAAEHGTLSSTAATHRRTGGRYRGAALGPTPAYSHRPVMPALIDLETAERALKIWLARCYIEPQSTPGRGQIEGSVYMGLGEALMKSKFGVGCTKRPLCSITRASPFSKCPRLKPS